MPDVVVHDCMRTEDWGPIVAPQECKHDSIHHVPIGLVSSKGDEVRCQAIICLTCGSERIGEMPWGAAVAQMLRETEGFLSIRVRMWRLGQSLAEAGRIEVRVPDGADPFDRQVWEERNLAPASWCHWSDAPESAA